MNREFPGVFRLIGLVAVVLGILAVLMIAFVDPQAPALPFRVVVSVHDSLIPPHTAAPPRRGEPPILEAEVQVRQDDVVMSSQGLRWRQRWFSVHLIEGQPALPPYARTVRAGEPEMMAFDIEDLTLVTWLHRGDTVAVASSASQQDLIDLALLVEPEGRYVPAVTPPRDRPAPPEPPGAAPGPAPAPR